MWDGRFVFRKLLPPTWMSPLATYNGITHVRKSLRWFWREINVDGRWMKDGGATGNSRPTQNKLVQEHVCVFLLMRSVAERIQTGAEWFGERAGAATHLFLTKRMATSTSSIKTRTPALIPAIFTTRSVCLAGSGMTSGSSVAPVHIVTKHMNTALHRKLTIFF